MIRAHNKSNDCRTGRFIRLMLRCTKDLG